MILLIHPRSIPTQATDTIITTIARTTRSAKSLASTSHINAIIIASISAVIGTALILALAFIGYAILRRQHRAAFQAFEAARLRDPTLSWEQHTRRYRLTRSRLFLEEELQRSSIIRKSLQSRASVMNERIRRLQHSGHAECAGARRGVNSEEEDDFLLQTRPDGENAVRKGASIVLNERHDSPAMGSGRVDKGEWRSEPPYPPPRLNTPPLLAHPALRGWTGLVH
ncbi:hypothetical protein AAE478_000061 [Parahypoxylon ruwenzoriense]